LPAGPPWTARGSAAGTPGPPSTTTAPRPRTPAAAPAPARPGEAPRRPPWAPSLRPFPAPAPPPPTLQDPCPTERARPANPAVPASAAVSRPPGVACGSYRSVPVRFYVMAWSGLIKTSVSRCVVSGQASSCFTTTYYLGGACYRGRPPPLSAGLRRHVVTGEKARQDARTRRSQNAICRI
jgi:hypothetical protein